MLTALQAVSSRVLLRFQELTLQAKANLQHDIECAAQAWNTYYVLSHELSADGLDPNHMD